jgi:hypothetical protein
MVLPFQQEIDTTFDTDGYLFPAPTKPTKDGNDGEDGDEDREDEDKEDTSHGTNAGYAINDEINPTMDTTRVTALMKRVTRRDLKLTEGFGMRDWRQIQAVLNSKFIHSALARVRNGEQEPLNAGALQATHTARTDVLRYGSQGLVVNTADINKYRGCSDDHQLYLWLTPRPPHEKWGITATVQALELPRS